MAFNQALLHVSRPLTDLVVQYNSALDGYARSFFLPRKPVIHLKDSIRQISTENLLRLYDAQASSDNVPDVEVQFRFDSDLSYSCKGVAMAAVLDALDSKNADAEIEYEQRTTMQLNISMQQRLEYLALNETLRSTSVMTRNTTLGSTELWDNYTSTASSPIDDLLAAQNSIRGRTGHVPNRLAMSFWTWNKFRQHPSVIARAPVHTVGPTGAIMTTKILADILEMQESDILIYNCNYTSNQWGATAVRKNFLGSDVIMAYVEPPSLSSFGLGYEFCFNGLTSDPVVVSSYPKPDRGILGANVIKMASIVDFKVTNADAGYLIKTVLDTTTAEYGSFLD